MRSGRVFLSFVVAIGEVSDVGGLEAGEVMGRLYGLGLTFCFLWLQIVKLIGKIDGEGTEFLLNFWRIVKRKRGICERQTQFSMGMKEEI